MQSIISWKTVVQFCDAILLAAILNCTTAFLSLFSEQQWQNFKISATFLYGEVWFDVSALQFWSCIRIQDWLAFLYFFLCKILCFCSVLIIQVHEIFINSIFIDMPAICGLIIDEHHICNKFIWFSAYYQISFDWFVNNCSSLFSAVEWKQVFFWQL